MPDHPPDSMLFDLEREDAKFLQDFNWVLEDSTILEPETDETKQHNIEHDNYINMEIGVRYNPEGPQQCDRLWDKHGRVSDAAVLLLVTGVLGGGFVLHLGCCSDRREFC